VRALLLAAALCACVPENGPLMRPGEDCLSCHGGVGGTESAQPWSAAGTVFAATTGSKGFEGAQVQIIDAKGFSFFLRTNLAGNFYTAENLAYPIQPCLTANGRTACQQGRVEKNNGGVSCNLCHQPAALGGTAPQLAPP
jgi:hypothetical protein